MSHYFRWRGNAGRTSQCWATVSSCHCRCASSTRTCAVCRAKKCRSWSRGDARWKTAATRRAAGWSACPSARPWSSRRRSCSGRWIGWAPRTQACGGSWKGWAPVSLPCSASPEVWNPEEAVCWPPHPVWTQPPSLPSWSHRSRGTSRESKEHPRAPHGYADTHRYTVWSHRPCILTYTGRKTSTSGEVQIYLHI